MRPVRGEQRKWLKSTIAQWTGDDVEITYEDVDTSLIPPRPRLYGLVGAEEIEKVWKERQAAKDAAAERQRQRRRGKVGGDRGTINIATP